MHFVVPGAIDDPDRVSGGNVYDRHVRDGLRNTGWDVRMVLIAEESGPLATRALSELPDGALVLIDGLIAVRESSALAAQSTRLRMIVLAHMVASLTSGLSADRTHLADLVDREGTALKSADRVIATSGWTRSELISRSLVQPRDVVTAYPGTDPAPATIASRAGGRLLCVGVVAPHKGQDVLVRAVARLKEVSDWTCTFVGSLSTEPDFVADLKRTVRGEQLATRVSFAGTLAGRSLDAAYGRADLVVAPSRTESFGMVVAEALARGIPVVASRVGGIPEALSSSGAGMLVPANDSAAFETVLREWWASPPLRTELTTAAVEARATVRSWSSTISTIESVLHEVSRSGTVVRA
ncbi:MAG: glycosyltransferase family 4 protein [Cryobacterium sp.]|uniref:glycosyltransferase family 4 protein n=1 Tax=Cryobacterium sp. TaxID=1926290 RepID=UPI00229A47A1|nr:glycosyltransferase family 4 protein [Cryobacterium sp.]MCY7403722.1 glycosyltransferase family 4 protein [Cryobacterium sp.]